MLPCGFARNLRWRSVFASLKTLRPKLERALTRHNALRRGLGVEEVSVGALYDELSEIAPAVLP